MNAMTTRILSVIVLAFLMTACNTQKKADSAAEQADPVEVTVAQILDEAANMVDQKVIISGSVTHVCRHGGQRLFIIGEDPEKTFKITTGEEIAEFDVSLEGSRILVSGIVKELIIDETYLAEWEAEAMQGAGVQGEGSGERPGEHEHAAGTVPMPDEDTGQDQVDEAAVDTEAQLKAQLDNIQSIRDEIAESGKDHLSEYWVEAISFTVTEEAEATEETEEEEIDE